MPSETRFAAVKAALKAKGYILERVRGSHRIFVKPGVKTFSIPVHHGKVLDVYVRQIEKLP
jgi:predicted RNA binding protein YcfA (HicA-like mRNA interferase family)